MWWRCINGCCPAKFGLTEAMPSKRAGMFHPFRASQRPINEKTMARLRPWRGTPFKFHVESMYRSMDPSTNSMPSRNMLSWSNERLSPRSTASANASNSRGDDGNPMMGSKSPTRRAHCTCSMCSTFAESVAQRRLEAPPGPPNKAIARSCSSIRR